MLKKNEKKYEVTIKDNNKVTDLTCNELEMLTLVNSGAKVIVEDPETGEILFDTDLSFNMVFDAGNLSEQIKIRRENEILQKEFNSLCIKADERLYDVLANLADELNITDDLNGPATESDIIEEIRRLRDKVHKARLAKVGAVDYAMRRINNIHIMDMGLSNRTYNCLKRAGKEFVGDILQMTEEDMIKIRNLGRRSLKEIEAKLAELGVALKDSKLSFDDKVNACCKYHDNCRMCPLSINSVDCFYNQSNFTSNAVDHAMGKEPNWFDPNMELKPVMHYDNDDEVEEF